MVLDLRITSTLDGVNICSVTEYYTTLQGTKLLGEDVELQRVEYTPLIIQASDVESWEAGRRTTTLE